MTALERALVVYAEAKGYSIELEYRLGFWKNKEEGYGFDFINFSYRIKNREDYRKTYDELSDFFKPLYTPEKKRTWNIEDLKKVPRQGFSCKTVTLTREEIEEMNKPKEKEFDVKAYVKSLVEMPEEKERYEEVQPIIEILEAYKNGETIERKEKYSSYEWSELWKGHVWNFSDFDYRISPKQPEAIPATEEELKEIDRGMICIKNKQTGQFGWVMKTDPIPEGMYIFNSVSKTCQDWGRNEQR